MEKIKITTDMNFEETIEKLRASLMSEGFGVITDIDMKKTMKEKINVDIEEYRILGACNPKFAHQILQLDKEMGRYLPCSIAVYKENNKTVICAVNPIEIASRTKNKQIEDIAKIVKEKLGKAINSLK